MTEKKKNDKVEKFNKKEIIVTVVVLLICVIVGITIGKLLYESMYGSL